MTNVAIVDQTITGKDINTIHLEFNSDFITLRELISERVRVEVGNYNRMASKDYFGLVIPTAFEKAVNKESRRGNLTVDEEKQIYVALDGFQKNQFFVLINGEQLDDLETKIDLPKIQQINFIKLTQLVGG